MRGFSLALLAAVSEASYYHTGAGHVHTIAESANYDPWASAPAANPTSWYSTNSQYSPARIPFVPAKHEGTIYAVCNFSTSSDFGTSGTGSLQFAQRGGKATMVRINLDANTSAADTHAFLIHEFGSIKVSGNTDCADLGKEFNPLLTMVRINLDANTSAADTHAFLIHEFGSIKVSGNTDCADLGNEFNPLLEKDKMNRFNPYQDPTRGRIADVTLDATGDLVDFVQKNVLVNLSGPDSIIGRSVAIYDDGYDSDNVTLLDKTPIDCCVIGYD
eukprot:CAMPEP_0185621956 /NCGR_PEP_ID=MMETSP0436-20130131/58949_1 /TAXON_ID=626734 ORGANISM="Favella taraikaensis, Strain Fe Narragansett Bay" /NCGR_SAMPLE_ID=MMETSP0436 /ASSEMBLY_ACC=CAM_ASM_000390 /LENGTH=273 /DNA_ID=CAMNT_0028263621 /DNA_START=14 /DNA_END=835 /DNA_ORIENTATION=-